MKHNDKCCTADSLKSAVATFTLSIFIALPTSAQEIEEVEVIGTTPTPGTEVEIFRVPHRVVSISSEDLDASMTSQISDYLARRVGGVFINEAQSNPLQPDLQYRGFTLSPLLGLPQGLAVYQDGVRLNEVFGDTLNWELIPENAVERVELVSGGDPLYGLNALGGVLAIRTKNGFDHVGHKLELDSGSFGRVVPSIESGGNNGIFSYFIAGSYEAEDGWRDLSETDAGNIFSSLGWRPEETVSLDLTISTADSKLIGNGATPEVLWELEDRDSVFTAPDVTENEMYMLNLSGKSEPVPGVTISGNAFYRRNKTSSFNGDGSEFEELPCFQGSDRSMQTNYLAEEDDLGNFATEDDINDFLNTRSAMNIPDGENMINIDGEDKVLCRLNGVDGDIIDPVNASEILSGDDDPRVEGIERDDDDEKFVLAEAGGIERNAINNRSERDQRSYGGSLQITFEHMLAGAENRLVAGGAYFAGDVSFFSSLEIASLQPDRSTSGSNIFIPEDGVRLDVDTYNYSAYLSDTLSITEQFDVTAAVRYNDTRIKLKDQGGNDNLTDENPDLTGSHGFSRFNPTAGITWRPFTSLTIFGSYSESNRAPTAVELACADADAPCNLPNAFLADPPLQQVVAKTAELGLRLADKYHIGAEIALFFTRNEDDILFQSTGGVASNEGFFANVGTTRRMGIDAGIYGKVNFIERAINWSVNYAYLEATYRDSFTILSANHPLAEEDDPMTHEFMVEPGDRIPGIPQHSAKAALDVNLTQHVRIGTEVIYHSSRYMRGDEANRDAEIAGYTLINLLAEYRPLPILQFFARVNNLLDTDYETFGLYGEPEEVLGDDLEAANIDEPSRRFFSPGAPINGFVGIRVVFK